MFDNSTAIESSNRIERIAFDVEMLNTRFWSGECVRYVWDTLHSPLVFL
jgi:hypothetical protein